MQQITVDVLVAGSGAAGLTAAVTARKAGFDVLIVEKEALIGGTSATSGGVLWVPGSHRSQEVQARLGVSDSRESARAYIFEEGGNYVDAARVDAYLDTAPEMVRFLEEETEVEFYGMDYPDYRSESANASIVRAIGTVDYQARQLGPHIKALKNQLPQTLFLGFAVGSGVEMIQFMRAGRSVKALGFVLRKLSRHFLDVIRYGEGQQMVRGRALIGRLARTLFDMNTPLWLSSPITSLIERDGMVEGAEVRTADGPVRVIARKGVILACGGYPNDPDRRRVTFPAPAIDTIGNNPTPTGNTGDGVRLAEDVGGQFNGDVSYPAAWTPASVLPGAKDFTGVWPHIVERQKPGFIAVLANGRRFADESSAYHDFVPEIIKANQGKPRAEAWLIGDARAIRKWGLGMARPFPVPHGHLVRSGYLKRGATLAALAEQCGIDPAGLELEVARFNANAVQGIDPDFGRGQRVYDRYQGDSEHTPNPCLGPLDTAPFYAVRIQASIIGTFAGLKTDAQARVLNGDNAPIEGLYAVGNDQASVFGGAYPGAGATLGPGMTFGYIAARHLAARG